MKYIKDDVFIDGDEALVNELETWKRERPDLHCIVSIHTGNIIASSVVPFFCSVVDKLTDYDFVASEDGVVIFGADKTLLLDRYHLYGTFRNILPEEENDIFGITVGYDLKYSGFTVRIMLLFPKGEEMEPETEETE